jgi:hypothetical protein
MEARQRSLAERDAFLESSVEAGERVVARSRGHPVVTDRRILEATWLRLHPRRGDWILASLPFEDVTSWSLGELYDHRPILDLERASRARIELGPAKHFLWFSWGIAEQPVIGTSHRLRFGKSTDPVLVAILGGSRDGGSLSGPRS